MAAPINLKFRLEREDETKLTCDVKLTKTDEGLSISVDGNECLYLDLYPIKEDRPAQLIVDAAGTGDPLAKVVLEKDGPVIVVDKDTKEVSGYENTITWSGDRVFREGK